MRKRRPIRRPVPFSLGADQTCLEVDVVVAALGLRGYEEARKGCDDHDGDEDPHPRRSVPTRLRALPHAFGWFIPPHRNDMA